jgi:hypothetical protein
VNQNRGFLERLLKRYLLLVATVSVSLVNGLDVSPVFDAVSFYLASFARNSPFFHADAFYYLTSLSISAMTMLLAGIPAALYERVRGLQQSSPASLAIWLLATLLLTLPVILLVLGSTEE